MDAYTKSNDSKLKIRKKNTKGSLVSVCIFVCALLVHCVIIIFRCWFVLFRSCLSDGRVYLFLYVHSLRARTYNTRRCMHSPYVFVCAVCFFVSLYFSMSFAIWHIIKSSHFKLNAFQTIQTIFTAYQILCNVRGPLMILRRDCGFPE